MFVSAAPHVVPVTARGLGLALPALLRQGPAERSPGGQLLELSMGTWPLS